MLPLARRGRVLPRLPAQSPRGRLLSGSLPSSYQPPATYSPRAPRGAAAGAPKFTMLFPPPNVTGKLHLGHALTVTIQDAAARFQRLLGKDVRWIHGMDHAGIATQTVCEKHLARQGVEVGALSREDKVARAWEWTQTHRALINAQLRALGASLDYEEEYFTLDGPRQDAVREAFCALAEQGLVYRAQRMVNWCPHLGTALSDLEVDHEEFSGPRTIALPSGEEAEFGLADDFAYVSADGQREVVVRTTRLETMLGDVAVAVHPADARFAHLHGTFVLHPFTKAELPVVCDAHLVDPAFGTGAVKLTPSHDMNDLEACKRAGLAWGRARVFGDDGKVALEGEFRGLSRFQLRRELRARLAALGLFRGSVPHAMVLARCSRSGDVIEPVLKPQWFVRVAALSASAKSQPIHFHPAEARTTYERWLTDTRDWCVSRQLWWGHRIPAYRVARRQGGGGSGGGSEAGGGEADQGGWVVARTREEAEAKLGSVDLEQDPDVLDTWFSSGLLPLSVNGWPRRPPAHTYPLSLMETGADILFFWVARMVMLCSHLSAAAAGPPFPHVYLHAMVRDKHGRKMSKSLGNVLDPSHVIEGVSAPHMLAALRAGNLDPRELARAEADVRADFPEGIPRLGTDALRLALASYSPASPVLFDVDRAAQARLFCNKMWQAVRFAKDFSPDRGGGSSSHAHEVSLEARWVRHRAAETAAACRAAYQDLNLSAASGAARRFFVADLCDVFLEACKSRRTADNALALRQCTSHALVMLHPVAPLITETLFEHLNGQALEAFPLELDAWTDAEAAAEMDLALEVTRAVRALRKRVGGGGSDVGSCVVLADNEARVRLTCSRYQVSAAVSPAGLDVAARLARAAGQLAKTEFGPDAGGLQEVLKDGLGSVRLVLGTDGGGAAESVAQRVEEERGRLRDRLAKLDKQLAKLQVVHDARVPAAVREKELARAAALRHQLAAVRLALDGLSSLA